MGQTGANTARLRIQGTDPEIVLELTLGADRAVREIAGQRWSNANPESIFKLQPFGGTVSAERGFEGYTIPGSREVGNHFGTSDYLPFFRVQVVSASFP